MPEILADILIGCGIAFVFFVAFKPLPQGQSKPRRRR
jgi:hypothetical protein